MARLRRELESSHSDLALSLAENRSMRVYLDRILEGLPCGVIVAATDGTISRVNPEALRLLELDSNSGAETPQTICSLSHGVRQLLESARQEGGEPELRVSPSAPGPRAGWRRGMP